MVINSCSDSLDRLISTYFAPPERSSEEELQEDIILAADNPVINGLMNLVNGFFAVLNSNRQILIVNDHYLKFLGIKDLTQIIGLRLGETINCAHAFEMEGGCGTSQACPTCGAIIATVSSLQKGTPQDKQCAITTEKDGVKDDIFLRVRAYPVDFEEKRLVMLFLQDISHQQKLEFLEKTFFHDINNIVTGLLGYSQLLGEKDFSKEKASKKIESLSNRLAREIAMQRLLIESEWHNEQPSYHTTTVNQIFDELNSIFEQHPAAKEKELIFAPQNIHETFNSDPTILIRVLTNMITNALEASAPNDEVKVKAEVTEKELFFKVWSRQTIPPEIQPRIFQRNFSTKGDRGRGLGTFSMKLFGEELLKGEVDFRSSPLEGTEFWIKLGR